MQIAYIFFYTLVYLSYLNHVWFPIERKHAPGDNEFNYKMFRLNVATPFIS